MTEKDFRDMTLVEQTHHVERYKVDCTECEWGPFYIRGTPYKAIGKKMEHHINDENEHKMTIEDYTLPKKCTLCGERAENPFYADLPNGDDSTVCFTCK